LEIGLGTFKELWINLFTGLGKVTYLEADHIFTLFEGNRKLQIEYGAPADNIQIIPNGVNVEVLSNPPSRALQRDSSRFRVGFVGRIVPIKDIKTLIKAARIVAQTVPDVEFYLCGPTDEDKDYYAECQTLVNALGLTNIIKFTGPVDVKTYYPCFDVQVMTSISEGQPLVILEGFCSGLPCVASVVGACREMINGRGEEDEALGPAGLVTWVGNPRQTAQAILKLWREPSLRQRMGQAGQARVRQYYDQKQLLESYAQIYKMAAAQSGRKRDQVAAGGP
jgi:glycosyltransferase involved in cell wall biosynthesis